MGMALMDGSLDGMVKSMSIDAYISTDVEVVCGGLLCVVSMTLKYSYVKVILL